MNKPLFGAKKESQFADTEPMNMSLASDDQYANTEPAPLARAAAPAIPDMGLSLAPVAAGDYELMAETRKEGRVCPQPTRWLEFYRVLQDNAKGVALPQPPLTGSAWASTPASAKRTAFMEQVEWAVKNGCITPAYEFLASLPKTDWHYGV